jgi:hypothetical protein
LGYQKNEKGFQDFLRTTFYKCVFKARKFELNGYKKIIKLKESFPFQPFVSKFQDFEILM